MDAARLERIARRVLQDYQHDVRYVGSMTELAAILNAADGEELIVKRDHFAYVIEAKK